MPLPRNGFSGTSYLTSGGGTLNLRSRVRTPGFSSARFITADGPNLDYDANAEQPSLAEAGGVVIATDDKGCTKKTTALKADGTAPEGYKKVVDKYWKDNKIQNAPAVAMKCTKGSDCDKECRIQIEKGTLRNGLRARTHYCACTDEEEKTAVF